MFFLENQYKARVSAFRRRNGVEIESKQKPEKKQMKNLFNMKPHRNRFIKKYVQ